MLLPYQYIMAYYIAENVAAVKMVETLVLADVNMEGFFAEPCSHTLLLSYDTPSS